MKIPLSTHSYLFLLDECSSAERRLKQNELREETRNGETRNHDLLNDIARHDDEEYDNDADYYRQGNTNALICRLSE